jgi:hypothetical protein
MPTLITLPTSAFSLATFPACGDVISTLGNVSCGRIAKNAAIDLHALVALNFAQRVKLLDDIADLDMPLDHLHLCDALSDIVELEVEETEGARRGVERACAAWGQRYMARQSAGR